MNFSIERAGFILKVFLFLLVALGYCTVVFANEAKMTWNPNTESDLAGYRIYYGTASNPNAQREDVKNHTCYVVKGLGSGTYFFSVTAYDTSNKESDHSIKVKKKFSEANASTTPLTCPE